MQNLIDNYRFERKFSIAHLSEDQIIAFIRNHPLRFSTLYPPRYINNIYFDTLAMDYYWNTIEGLMNREKYRIRWYGDLVSKLPLDANLEIKIKRNHINRKEIFQLEDDAIDLSKPFEAVKWVQLSNDVPDHVKQKVRCLRPTLVNRYFRRYFASFNGEFRVTVDTRLHYFPVNRALCNDVSPFADDPNVIVELKYNFEHDSLAEKFSSSLPVRLTRNSKYVNGVDNLKERSLVM